MESSHSQPNTGGGSTVSDPCDTCALRKESETWNEPYNRLCAMAGIPFMCHHGFDYTSAHIGVVKGRFITIGVEDTRELRMCAGWKRETARFKKLGQFVGSREARREQQWWGNYALQLVSAFVDEKDQQQKEHYNKELAAVIKMLTAPRKVSPNEMPHCYNTAPRVDCIKCTRQMCKDCIHTGQLCGSCFDDEQERIRRRELSA